MKYRVYGDMASGNCYKVALLMSLLDIEAAWEHVDILRGETRNDAFLARNANGRIPLLEIDGESYLSESNAILHYLAEGSPLLPTDRLAHARVLQWQCFEQYSHEPYIAVARFIQRYLGMPAERRDEYLAKQDGGHAALRVMDSHLAAQDWFVGAAPTIADVSLYAYTHVAPEGGFALDAYANVQRWLQRVEALPGYRPMS